MFFVIPLFLLCAVVFTLYLVGMTVRDARRVVEEKEKAEEKKKDIAAIQQKFANQNIVSVGVTGCCGCEGDCDCEEDRDEDVFESDLYADPELRRQVVWEKNQSTWTNWIKVKEELERTYTDVSEEMMTEMIDRWNIWSWGYTLWNCWEWNMKADSNDAISVQLFLPSTLQLLVYKRISQVFNLGFKISLHITKHDISQWKLPSYSFCPTPRSNSGAELAGSLLKVHHITCARGRALSWCICLF